MDYSSILVLSLSCCADRTRCYYEVRDFEYVRSSGAGIEPVLEVPQDLAVGEASADPARHNERQANGILASVRPEIRRIDNEVTEVALRLEEGNG